jgi:hypothetical protein
LAVIINAMQGDDFAAMPRPSERGFNNRGRQHVTLKAKCSSHLNSPSRGDQYSA